MADSGGSDWGDLWSDFIGGLGDLWPGSDPGNGMIRCAIDLSHLDPNSPEYAARLAQCRQLFGGTGIGSGHTTTPDPVADIESDISGFLASILGGVTGDFDDLLGTLTNTLRGAIGGLGTTASATVGNIGDIAGSILGGIGGSSRNAIDILGLTAGSVIEGVGTTVDTITTNIGAYIEDFLKKIRQAITSMVDTIGTTVSNALNSAVSTITRVVNGLLDSIQATVTSAIESVTHLFNQIIDNVEDLIKGAVDSITAVADKVFTAVAETVDAIKTTLETAFNNIVEFIGNQIEAAGEFINAATQTLKDVGQSLVEGANEILDSINTGISGAIDALVTASDSAISTVRESLDTLQTALSSAVDQIGPILQTALSTSPLGLAAQGAIALQETFQNALSITLETPEDDLAKILRSIGVTEEGIKRVIDMSKTVFTDAPVLRSIFLIFISILIAQNFAGQIAAAAGVKALQDIQPGFSVALPDLGSVNEMQRLGLMNDEEARATLQRSGYSDNDAMRLEQLKKRTPEIGIVQVWFLRQFIDRNTALEKLENLGLDRGDSERILQMAFFIPPPGDLITMAVREAFSPDIAEKFGQYEQFPEQFAHFAALQGIDEDWAKRYWAAHWSLPSATMGFEMLHRRVIDDGELDLLLRAHDVMPFWREKLKQISYNPLTRVDVRRMHKLGVLSDQEVFNAYLDIGYTKENAKRLLDFTIELNKTEDVSDPKSVEDLTRAAVTDLYKKKTLTRKQAHELLVTLGIGSAAADIFLDIVDLNSDSEDRDAQTKIIIDQAKLGIITFTEAQDKLSALGLEPLEVERALLDLQRARDAATKIPTHQELDKLIQAKLINDAVYLDTMLRNGYNVIWAERFLQLAKLG